MGILSFGLAFALLTGNPIAGALLTPHHLWQRPLIFAAVSLSRSSHIYTEDLIELLLFLFQVSVLMGAISFCLIWTSITKRRGTQKV